MKDYAGVSANDQAVGGHGYLKQGNIGHEVWNFMPFKSKVYGYVPRSARINLKNLGGSTADKFVQPATVVWIARNPSNKKTYIVGWYKNATVYKENDHIKLNRKGGFEVGYQIVAPAEDATLLPVDRRLYHIPTAKAPGNLGQSPVWYGGNQDFRDAVNSYIESGGNFAVGASAKAKSKSPKRQTNPELRKQIELAAVRHAKAYYESVEGGSQIVDSVEKDGVGWDLNVTAPTGAILKVEVKGLSGKEVVVELTPNEYKKMKDTNHRSQYVIYVLTEALTSNARSHVFRHNAEASKSGKLVWVASDGRQLEIKPVIAARLTAPFE
ncbi:DUF3883 domain-containing protein [Methylorubrum thiocyanatum]|uniref:DUF3883 domain-containing protein n=1 Tax=Methylorubrum thiocyanatum TaxID=47958 RepID=UPI003F819244